MSDFDKRASMRAWRSRVDTPAAAMLFLYFAAWTILLGMTTSWLLGALTACGYFTGQLVALVRRGHAALSAESLALPAAVTAHIAGIALLHSVEYTAVTRRHWLELVVPLGFAWFAGHAAAFAGAALADWWQRRKGSA